MLNLLLLLLNFNCNEFPTFRLPDYSRHCVSEFFYFNVRAFNFQSPSSQVLKFRSNRNSGTIGSSWPSMFRCVLEISIYLRFLRSCKEISKVLATTDAKSLGQSENLRATNLTVSFENQLRASIARNREISIFRISIQVCFDSSPRERNENKKK